MTSSWYYDRASSCCCYCCNEIATQADFFSFGTNDLTQTTFGFSRDDVEAEFVPQYLAERILPYNPFATVDPGVAKLVEMGVELGHQGNPDIQCGVCGEHGGDPDSIKTFYKIGLDYVSCSPIVFLWHVWLLHRLHWLTNKLRMSLFV